MAMDGKRICILVENYYQEMEVWYPLYRLVEAGADVFTVGPEAGATYKSKLGYPVKADRAIADVTSADVDAIVIPGGWSPDYMRRDPKFAALIKAADSGGKPLAAICHGPWMLTSADVVRGKKVTSFHSIKDDVLHAGGVWSDEEVVVDGNLITARKPDDLPAFCKAILSALG